MVVLRRIGRIILKAEKNYRRRVNQLWVEKAPDNDKLANHSEIKRINKLSHRN